MTHRRLLAISSVLSVLLLTLHTADDIGRGIEPGTLANIGLLPICAVWLYAALVIVLVVRPGGLLGERDRTPRPV